MKKKPQYPLKRISIELFSLLFILCLSANACKKSPHTESLQLAVYRWKTNSRLLPSERAWLDSLHIQRLYLRFFDLDLNPSSDIPQPVAPLQLPMQGLPDSLHIVPVVFITNRSLQHLPKGKVQDLADKLYNKIKYMIQYLPKGSQVPEWQLDCDWSESTGNIFFALLENLRQRLHAEGILLSATIRLYQARYPHITGVPPVDRGMLMFYNMTDVRQANTRNSIIDLTAARHYYKGLKNYPLPLDLALPIFHWVVVRREGMVVQLLSGLDENALQDQSRFIRLESNSTKGLTSSKQPRATQYLVKNSTYLNAYYLYAGDTLRVEGVSIDTLAKAWQELQAQLPAQSNRYLSFYHLDTSATNRFNHEKIKQILQK